MEANRAEVFIKYDNQGEKLVLLCPRCKKEYVPNTGYVSRCPICYEVFCPSFEKVEQEFLFDEQRWMRPLEGCAKSAVELIRCDGGGWRGFIWICICGWRIGRG